MAVNKKISQLGSGTPTDGDLLPFVDVETGDTLKTTTENFIMNNVVNNIGNSNLNTFKKSCLLTLNGNVPLHGEYEYSPGFFTEDSRIVLSGQTDVTQNGIWITSNDDWQRAPDCTERMNIAGAIVYCNYPNGGSLYVAGQTFGGTELLMIVGSSEFPVYFNSALNVQFLQSSTLEVTQVIAHGEVGIENNLILSSLNPSCLLSTDEDSIVTSLSTDTYPSLEEISYVKGVTSNIQDQLDSVSGGTWVPYEIPTPDTDDTTTVFEIQHVPLPGTQSVYKNGVFLDDEDYSISGSTITFVSAPKVTDKIRVHYAH